ncbi:hypothetical protein [Streptomyces sp. SLBN-31]|uniref:hypothetical protein n=1 Tax=Streptomyces sp. SLBN-31 TaxID=2768444 RepID=UPI00115039E4|nr:hypothetical protein [Streptomyces sp. SLBN-31]TQJ92424.1 hypothetical protein FBY22_3285 [Streptomyces sp. SLBN-31]
MIHEPTRPRRAHRPETGRRAALARTLVGIALLGSVLTLVAALPAGAERPEPPPPATSVPATQDDTTHFTAGHCPTTDFGAAVRCWGDDASGDHMAVVTVTAPQEFHQDAGSRSMAEAVRRLRGKLTVIVPDGVRTGSGGTLLLALAAYRVVGPHTLISPLTERDGQQLADQGGCPQNGFCDVVRTHQRSGDELVRRGLAQDTRTSLFTAGPGMAGATADAGGGTESGVSGDVAFLLVVLAVLLCLVTALGLLVGRTRRPRRPSAPAMAAAGSAAAATGSADGSVGGAPRRSGDSPDRRDRADHRGHRAGSRPSTVPVAAMTADPGRQHGEESTVPPARVREPAARQRSTGGRGRGEGLLSATVRTVLGPQGYVAINGLLYRARWGGAGEPPEPGRPVEVRRESTGELTVLGDDEISRFG